MPPRKKIGRRFLAAGGCLLAAAAASWFALRWVPLPVGLENDPLPALVITDRKGRPLRELPEADGTFPRPALPLTDISPHLRQATLAAEDQRFFDHGGVDWRATARAFASQFTPGLRRSGGSTVSQQLIKLAVPPASGRSWSAKAGRMAQAMRLEQVWDKPRILEAYLNRLPYGNGHVGCAAAAEGYFNKSPCDLSPAEAAFLAALPQAPGRLNPYRHFARAKGRQEWVLRRMAADGSLPADDLARALVEPLRLRPRGRVFRAGHWTDFILGQRRAEIAAARASGVGVVRTTLDAGLGNAEVRLLESTNAYATLVRLGEHRPVRLLADDPTVPGRPVGDARAAWLIADILADNGARTPAFGANSPLRWEFPVAVKTGTSTDFRDNWAFGFTPEFTVGVWVGNFDGTPMAGVSGVSGAGPLLHAIFERLHAERGTTWFPVPDGIAEGLVHPVTGHLLAPGTPGGVRECFPAEHPPALKTRLRTTTRWAARGCRRNTPTG